MTNPNVLNRVPVKEMFTTNLFRYSNPTEPIVKEGFAGATWGDVDPPPIKTMFVRGKKQDVKVFGFQALRGNCLSPASIVMHPELKETELTYLIKGVMDMQINTPSEYPVISSMLGPIPRDFQGLDAALFSIRNDGALVISVDGSEYVSFPTVTPVGSSHGTKPLSKECIYLAVKVSE